jgi:hypothetical protein
MSLVRTPCRDPKRHFPAVTKEADSDDVLTAIIIVFVGLSGLGLLGVLILPATASEGWVPFIVLLATLGLIVTALLEVTRNE